MHWRRYWNLALAALAVSLIGCAERTAPLANEPIQQGLSLIPRHDFSAPSYVSYPVVRGAFLLRLLVPD
jgi:hypothetical protein